MSTDDLDQVDQMYEQSLLRRVRGILVRIQCGQFRFRTAPLGDGLFLQATFLAPCTETGEMEVQRGRKFYLSPHMTDSEIVQTAFLAAKIAMEHELRETFRYKGELIFGPHFSSEALAEFAKERRIDAREQHQEV